MGNILIEVKNLSQSFKVGDETIQSLKNVNATFEENTFNILYGASGSGKSTFLNAISGLQTPSQGSVVFQGQDIYQLSRDKLAHFRANRVGVIYQDNYWIKSLNVVENVAIPLSFLGYPRSIANKLAMQALERVNIAQYAKKIPYLLSLGEQQRVAAARAIVNNPLFVIADEPTGNLDSQNGDAIMGLLQKCIVDFKCTIILVTHNLEYLPLADSLLHIQDGEIQQLSSGDVQQSIDQLMGQVRSRIDRYREAKHG